MLLSTYFFSNYPTDLYVIVVSLISYYGSFFNLPLNNDVP